MVLFLKTKKKWFQQGFVVLKEFKRYTPPYGFYAVMWQVPDNKPNSIEPQYKHVPLEAIPDHHYESNAVFGFIAADIIVYAAVVAVYPWIYPTFNWPASVSLDAFNNANVLVSGMIVFLGLGMIASFKTLRDKSARKTFVCLLKCCFFFKKKKLNFFFS